MGPPTKKAELRAKNLSILTIDGGYGFGNGHVIPALLRGLGDVLVKLRAIFLSQVFDLQLVRLGIGPKALKRGVTLMDDKNAPALVGTVWLRDDAGKGFHSL